MKKIISTLLMAVAVNCALATDYYVATNGSDSNKGTLKAPFKTIQHAVSKLKSGDVCYVRKGIYRENVVINTSGVTLKAYNNENVTVTGSEFVNNWENYKGEIYRAKVESEIEPQFTQVVYGGKLQDMARYPDHVGDDMFTLEDGYADLEVKPYGEVEFDETLPGGVDYWKGGYFRAVCAKAGATNPNGRIASSSGRNLQCEDISDIWERSSSGNQVWKAVGVGKGYIFHLNALSRPGEWWYEDGYVYFWRPKGEPFGGKPENNAVEIQTREYTITVENQKNVTIDGINVRLASIKLNNVTDCEVLNSTFRDVKGWTYQKGYGLSYTECGGTYVHGKDVKFQNCYFNGSWGNLLNFKDCQDIEVDNCILENCGWMGFFTASLLSTTDNLKISNSTFGSTGRFHVRSDGDHYIDIQHNIFTDCMKMCQDAGSIQLEQSGSSPIGLDMKGSVIAYNVFHDMNTLPAWSKEDTQYVVALYFEGAGNYIVHHNLFYNITNDREDGAFVYMGPRWATIEKCYFVNNTVWNIDYRIRTWNFKKFDTRGEIKDARCVNNLFMSGMKHMLGIPTFKDGFTFTNNDEVDKNYMQFYFEDAKNNNFKLKATSPAVDAGVEFKGITDGFKGKSPDIGCYEYGTTPWKCGATLEVPKF